MLSVIYNPVSGDSTAKAFIEEHVVPLLESKGLTIDSIHGTRYPGHAGSLLVELIESASGSQNNELTLVLASGDGTLHELLNAQPVQQLAEEKLNKVTESVPRINLVLIPSGTANALYSSFFPPSSPDAWKDTEYRLQSVNAFASKNSKTAPLSLALTTFYNPSSIDDEAILPTVASSVVVSTSLHASILHDSEQLRAETPGIERFKIAAQQNISRWYSSNVKLLPVPSTGQVEVYDPQTQEFKSHTTPELEGPFAYFLSAVNVDRLEPAFRIAPLVKRIPPASISLDVIVVRPSRDPSNSAADGQRVNDTKEKKEEFAAKSAHILGAAYEDGAHVDMRYQEDGKIIGTGEGKAVVEYFRCGGWEWSPVEGDDAAHLVCTDGLITTLKPGGKAVCKVSEQDVPAPVFSLHVLN